MWSFLLEAYFVIEGARLTNRAFKTVGGAIGYLFLFILFAALFSQCL